MTGWTSRMIEVMTAGRRGSETEMHQVAQALRGQAQQEQPAQALRAGASSRSPPTTPTPPATTAVITVARATGPAGPSGIAAAHPDDQQVARVADRRQQPEDDPEPRVRAVRPAADDPGDEHDPGQDDGHRDHRRARRPLPEDQPRDDAHDEHLEVAQHGGQARPDPFDAVVPEHEVAGEEDAGDGGQPPRSPGEWPVAPVLHDRHDRRAGATRTRPDRPSRSRARPRHTGRAPRRRRCTPRR